MYIPLILKSANIAPSVWNLQSIRETIRNKLGTTASQNNVHRLDR